MIIGRPANIVPIVSKMRKINLLNQNDSPNQQQQTSRMGHGGSSNYVNSDKSFRGSPNSPGYHDQANSSVKTFETPRIQLAPRPLNFVYQIQQERELQELATADRATSQGASINDQDSKLRENKADSTDGEKPYAEQYQTFDGTGTLRITDSQLKHYALGQIVEEGGGSKIVISNLQGSGISFHHGGNFHQFGVLVNP